MERDFLPPKSEILYQLFSVYTVYVHRILPSPIHSPSVQQILVVFYVTGIGDLTNKAIGISVLMEITGGHCKMNKLTR